MLSDMKKIEVLVNRARLLAPEAPSMPTVQIKHIEESLGVLFSIDLKEIVERFRFDYLVFEFYNFDDNEIGDYGVIPETRKLREVLGFPRDRVVLAQDGGFLIILKTMPISSEPSPVHWIDILDLERYCKGIPLECHYQIFPSFADFFEYLVTEAEERLAEERAWKKEQSKDPH